MSIFFGSVFSFILAIVILVTFHELGHFWVARLCKVKVLRFSIGFGPVLYKKIDKKGTEFCFSAIPLGGYVKMLDERETEVELVDLKYAFNRKSPLKKIAIVLAGPVANFILAFFMFYAMYLNGVQVERPVIQYVEPGSIADRAGLKNSEEIISVDEKLINSFEDLQGALANKLGTKANIIIKTVKFKSEKLTDTQFSNLNTYSLDINNWEVNLNKEPIAKSLGISMLPKEPFALMIDKIDLTTNANLYNLNSGDIVIGYNRQAIDSIDKFIEYIKKHPEEKMLITVLRDGNKQEFSIKIGSKIIIDSEYPNVKQGLLGISFKFPLFLEQYSYGVIGSAAKAVQKLWNNIEQTCYMMYKILFGQIGLDTIRGPVMIAKVAGIQIQVGLSSFLNFLGLISISLGVINLLPIPVLDGGHVIYHFYELITGKQASRLVEIIGVVIGLVFLGFLISLAFYNDFIYW